MSHPQSCSLTRCMPGCCPACIPVLSCLHSCAAVRFQQEIPNIPIVGGQPWPGVGHNAREGGGARNPFGQVKPRTRSVFISDCTIKCMHLGKGGRLLHEDTLLWTGEVWLSRSGGFCRLAFFCLWLHPAAWWPGWCSVRQSPVTIRLAVSAHLTRSIIVSDCAVKCMNFSERVA